ncbi:MAG: MBL fold metallo-hydrolase [Deltaproteobacteria bacterium]|nr:MBL fold metallo-hydrolase [Deltaproteobacteria bacterium]
MRIKFHGPIDEVTGSCYELIDDVMQVHMLVDCGLVQGPPDAEKRNRAPLPFDPRTLTHVVLTHAHIDHSGLIPRLYAEGYRESVYCTRETAELARLVLEDCAQLGGVPYTKRDVARIKFHEPTKATSFGCYCPIGPDLLLRFYRSGHILGATSVTLHWGAKEATRAISFSGDLGPNVKDAEILPLMGYRMSPARSDYAVIESTYGGTVRPPISMEERLAQLAAALDRGLVERRGVIVIPCFALERMQDVLCDLTFLFAREPERFADVPVILDSTLALKANQIMANAFERTTIVKDGTRASDTWLGRGLYRLLGLDRKDPDARPVVLDAVREMLTDRAETTRVTEVPHPAGGPLASWRRIWRRRERQTTVTGPAIVLAAGGMCEGGPVQYYLLRLLGDPTTTVLLPGYCGPATVGGQLLAMKNLPREQRLRLDGSIDMVPGSVRRCEVEATIETLAGYSAHADQEGLVAWLWSAPKDQPKVPIAKTVFVSHGEPGPRAALAAAIEKRAAAEGHSVKVELPPRGRWFDLDSGEWLEDGLSQHDIMRLENERLRREIAALRGSQSAR